MDIRNRIVLPLDVPTEKEALGLVDSLQEFIGVFKVGLELLNAIGPSIVEKLLARGVKVFLDGKFMDIPNTTANAAAAVSRMGVAMFNVHAFGGKEMMKAAVDAADSASKAIHRPRPLVLAVTVLTSLDQKALNDELRIPGPVEAQVVHLARLADDAGLDGVIASPWEVEAIRKVVSDRMLLVTPGVRPLWASAQDQKRVMTPGEAISKGASLVVVGRPITKPPPNIGDSIRAAKMISEEVATALAGKER